ncbi:MAG: carboxylating nicotinate-nucleotide diphosphorylase [Cyanophyceae cyanobacterium]
MKTSAFFPSWIVVDPLLHQWLLEDIGRGDRTTDGLLAGTSKSGSAVWIAKEAGMIAGLKIAERVFFLLNNQVNFVTAIAEGAHVTPGEKIAHLQGPLDALLTGERLALNLTMHLSGIATATRRYVNTIADLPVQLVDTRKTTPGLRILEKYATTVGGAVNHRIGLDDAIMIKDNHIQAAGGIGPAIARLRQTIPYPLTIEVETNTLAEVEEALIQEADIIMLDNMSVEEMKKAVQVVRQRSKRVKIEASGNVTLQTLRRIAQTGIDYISSSAPITRSTWLDLSMKLDVHG